jgi:hypothetical protein
MKRTYFYFLFFILFLLSCQGNKQNRNEEYLPDEMITDEELIEEGDYEPKPSETIDWKDGNSYSYDYTEAITKTDSLGNEQIITVYKRNKPSDGDIVCEPKMCKWCSITT